MIEVKSICKRDPEEFDERLSELLNEGFTIAGYGKVALFNTAGSSMWYATLTRGNIEGRKV